MQPRRRLLDNPRVLTVVAVLLLAVLAGLFWLSDRTADIAPQVLTDVLLYALLAVDVALLLALGFVLARNLLKLWVEQRQAAPFARFRAKLVAALLAMSIIPAVLVLISGSEILRTSAARWFSEPVEEILSASQLVASQFYQEQKEAMTLRAQRLARTLPPAAVAAGDESAVTATIKDESSTLRDSMIELYRVPEGAAGNAALLLVAAVESSTLPGENVRASADRLAFRAVESRADQIGEDLLGSGGVLLRAASPIRTVDGKAVGAVVVSRYLGAALDKEARRVTAAYERYQGLRYLRTPILATYLSIFLTVTLLILIAATWLGLYLAKRITRPVQQLAEGARAIGAGDLDVRLQAETGDELGSLVEAFNMMAAELQTNRGKLEQSREDLGAQEHRGRGTTSLHRDDSGARGDGGHFARCRRAHLHRQWRGGTAARHRMRQRRAAGARGVCPRRPAAAAAARDGGGGARRAGPACRKSPSRARAVRSTSQPPRPCSPAATGRWTARCWCSTTSRRSFARSAWRPGGMSRAGWRTKSRTR